MKTTKKGALDLKELNEIIVKMLEEAIIEDDVIVLTKAGSGAIFDLLDDENMMKLKIMHQKNIAANILIKAIRDKIEQIKKKNIVVSRTFSEKLKI